jgi:hypothetical protein
MPARLRENRRSILRRLLQQGAPGQATSENLPIDWLAGRLNRFFGWRARELTIYMVRLDPDRFCVVDRKARAVACHRGVADGQHNA